MTLDNCEPGIRLLGHPVYIPPVIYWSQEQFIISPSCIGGLGEAGKRGSGKKKKRRRRRRRKRRRRSEGWEVDVLLMWYNKLG